MSPIQLILILLLTGATVMYFQRLRTRFLDNVIVVALAAAGVVFIAMPEWTTRIAHVVGVQRGTDLIMYLGWFGVAFVCLLLYSKIRTLQAQMTELVRAQAIQRAWRPKQDQS
jgi:small membrane protein